MASSETQYIIDSNTIIIVPAGQSLSSEQIAAVLAQIKAGNATNNVSTCNSSVSADVTEANACAMPESIEIEAAYCTNHISNQAYSSQVLTPISPNVLTPENSPIVSHAYNTTPKAARVNFTQLDESPFTLLSSRQIPDSTSIATANIKHNVPFSLVCNQLPAIKKDVKPFGTLVFFDLETTGLGHTIGVSNVQITEISMVALDRKEFWLSKNSELKEIRIMHKLSMCVRPRTAVSPGASKITGLDNFNLIDQYPFDKNAAMTIVSFLSHLPKPVCLLAHNGNAFDFPLLKSEFKRLSIELPSDLLVADTLVAFRTIGIVENPPDRKVCKSVKYGKNGRLSHSLENLHLFFFNKKPANGHSSEGDSLALAKICHKLKEDALPYLEANAQTMDSITPMW